MGAVGWGVSGSRLNHIFNVTIADGQWFSFRGTDGSDTCNLTFAGGRGVIDFGYGQSGNADCLDIKLATGITADDGPDFCETINVSGDADDSLEIHATLGDDRLIGSARKDLFSPGRGNDTLDLSAQARGTVFVYHGDLATETAFSVSLSNQTNSATIDKGVYRTTTIVDAAALFGGDLGILFGGSQFDDTFTTAWTGENGVGIHAGRGNDTIDLTGSTTHVFLAYLSDLRFKNTLGGIDINLATGVLANVGFGGTDTIIGVSGNTIRIARTQFDDTFVSGDSDDQISIYGGEDQLDGGAGIYTVIASGRAADDRIMTDLANGTLGAVFNGITSVSLIVNFENATGNDNDDTLIGDGDTNELRGAGGADNLFGGSGVDSLFGGDGFNGVFMDGKITMRLSPFAQPDCWLKHSKMAGILSQPMSSGSSWTAHSCRTTLSSL